MADIAELDIELQEAPPVERKRLERPRVTRKPRPVAEPNWDEAAERELCRRMAEMGLAYS
jgi:hypothetical protein